MRTNRVLDLLLRYKAITSIPVKEETMICHLYYVSGVFVWSTCGQTHLGGGIAGGKCDILIFRCNSDIIRCSTFSVV